MMEAVSETLETNAILTRLIARESFHYIQSPWEIQILHSLMQVFVEESGRRWRKFIQTGVDFIFKVVYVGN